MELKSDLPGPDHDYYSKSLKNLTVPIFGNCRTGFPNKNLKKWSCWLPASTSYAIKVANFVRFICIRIGGMMYISVYEIK